MNHRTIYAAIALFTWITAVSGNEKPEGTDKALVEQKKKLAYPVPPPSKLPRIKLTERDGLIFKDDSEYEKAIKSLLCPD